jgi:hypothetical protein
LFSFLLSGLFFVGVEQRARFVQLPRVQQRERRAQFRADGGIVPVSLPQAEPLDGQPQVVAVYRKRGLDVLARSRCVVSKSR